MIPISGIEGFACSNARATPPRALHPFPDKSPAEAIATVLTSEDVFRSIRHDGQGRDFSGDDDLADADVIVPGFEIFRTMNEFSLGYVSIAA